MAEDLKTVAAQLSASDFLTALESSGILGETGWQDLRARLRPGVEFEDSLVVARGIVHEGLLTPYQASRLLRGKKVVFGRYILLEHIGQGARGKVFRARHALMDRVVALKVVIADPSLSKRTVARFFREMKIVGLLDHPNVVRAIDADIHDGRPYIVMEFLEGQDLEQVFSHRGPLPPGEVVSFMAQAARGLAHAHDRGVIHRDIKPTNLLLTTNGVVKVLDLGFGELVGAAQKARDAFDTDEGVLVGTTDFMSPEQVHRRPIDARTDLFSLGCTMYRLLTGTYAYPGETREHRLVKRIQQAPVPIRDVRPDLPGALVRIVDRLLAARPSDRFASAADAADAMEVLIPRSGRADRRKTTAPSENPSGEIVEPIHSEPEAPLDWSVIESALHAPREKSPESSRLVDREEPKAPSSQGLTSHRKALEEQGLESGREAHENYRHEVVQMNRVMAELKSMEPKDDEPEAGPTWLEQLGEKVGDYLAEPTMGPAVIAGLIVLLLLGLALACSVG